MKISKTQTHRKKRLIFYLISKEIKTQNIIFAVSYSEKGNKEIYTDYLQYFEIEKPKNKKIVIQNIAILKNEKIIKQFSKIGSLKFLDLLDYNNKKNKNVRPLL